MSLDDPLPSLLLQLVLILVNAFFSCAEIAVITLNDGKLKKNAESGDKKAQTLVRLTAQPARFLATIQVGITLAGFLGSAFAANNFSTPLVHWLHDGLHIGIAESTLETIAVIAITIILSYVTLVLGELVPKRIAMQKAEPIAMAVGGLITFVSKVAAPLVWLLTASTNGLLRLFRMNPEAEQDNVTQEEIRIMVDLGEEKGTIAPEEGEMIDNVFELGNKTAEEVMTHRTDMSVLWMEDGIEQWEETICGTNYSRYPVCGEDMDDVVGILHVRDYFCNLRMPEPQDIKSLLRPAYIVPETASADVLFREMKRNRVHIAVVVDEYGGTSGILTLEDLLEEVVGQIEDEHDDQEMEIVTLGENHWRVRGSAAIDYLTEELCLDFPEGDYDTLGGLIFAQMSSIPEDGTHPEVDVGNLHILVEELMDHRVEWAEITVTEPETTETETEE